MSTKQRNHTIDALKFIFSLCIIGVHLHVFEDISTVLFRTLTQSLFRIGVPFNFIVSGYYFARTLNHREKSDAYLKRLLRIYIAFEIVDIVLNTAAGIRFPLSYAVMRFFTTGLNRIYWYLISLILTCFLCRPLWKRGYAAYLIISGFILYLLTMTFDSYSFLSYGKILKASRSSMNPYGYGRRQVSANPSCFFPSAFFSVRRTRRSKDRGFCF